MGRFKQLGKKRIGHSPYILSNLNYDQVNPLVMQFETYASMNCPK